MTEYIGLDLLESTINSFISQNEILHNELNIQKQIFYISVSEKGKRTNYQFKINGLIEIERYYQYEGSLFEECEKLDLLINKLIENHYIKEHNNKLWFVNQLYPDPEIWTWINILKEENVHLQNELNELKQGLHRL